MKRPVSRISVLGAIAGLVLAGAAIGSTAAASTPGTTSAHGGTVAGAIEVPDSERTASPAAAKFKEIRAAQAEGVKQIHPSWGVFLPNPGGGDGAMATQTVTPGLTMSGGNDFTYAPTMKPGNHSCIEAVTSYSGEGSFVWAWDWCGSIGVAKKVRIDDSFMATYGTTTPDGYAAYTTQDMLTNPSTNEWTMSLYNYSTGQWDTLFTSSGTDQVGQERGWDVFELYTTINPATGVGYYCGDGPDSVYDSSSIQLLKDGNWVAATPDVAPIQPANPQGSDFYCPRLSFNVPSANDHWSVL